VKRFWAVFFDVKGVDIPMTPATFDKIYTAIGLLLFVAGGAMTIALFVANIGNPEYVPGGWGSPWLWLVVLLLGLTQVLVTTLFLTTQALRRASKELMALRR
jgi:hypothetical protein